MSVSSQAPRVGMRHPVLSSANDFACRLQALSEMLNRWPTAAPQLAAVALRLAQSWGDATAVRTAPVRQQVCMLMNVEMKQGNKFAITAQVSRAQVSFLFVSQLQQELRASLAQNALDSIPVGETQCLKVDNFHYLSRRT